MQEQLSPSVKFAEPKNVSDLSQCHFYHTIDIPGYGVQEGAFDLRNGVHDYLGNVDFCGKRVIELGPANGFLTFHMEKLGAEVVCCDLSPNLAWDIVPYDGVDVKRRISETKSHIEKINNAFWLGHKAFNSSAKVAYTTAYDIPEDIGTFDVAVFGLVLLHLRDPFRALESILRHCERKVVVVETMMSRKQKWIWSVLNRLQRVPSHPIFFLPSSTRKQTQDTTWWKFPEWTMERFLEVLGFEKSSLIYHEQVWRRAKSGRARLYTMVADRRSGTVSEA